MSAVFEVRATGEVSANVPARLRDAARAAAEQARAMLTAQRHLVRPAGIEDDYARHARHIEEWRSQC
jgi:hypothetical protein